MSYGNGGQFSFPSVSSGMSHEDLLNLVAKMQKELNWLLNNLDSANVTQINTNLTQIKSENGKTIIEGPLLEMYDESGILRLKQGLDESTGTFAFELLDGIITGGMLRTAKTGPRIEITQVGIKSYNSLNQYHGIVFDPAATDADFSLYFNGVKYFMVKRYGNGIGLFSNGDTVNESFLLYDFNNRAVWAMGTWDFLGTVTGLEDSGYATKDYVDNKMAQHIIDYHSA